MPELSFEQKMELAISAKEFVESSIFRKVVTHLIKEQVETLQRVPLGDLTATDAHGVLRALNLMEATLRALASEKAVLEKKGKA